MFFFVCVCVCVCVNSVLLISPLSTNVSPLILFPSNAMTTRQHQDARITWHTNWRLKKIETRNAASLPSWSERERKKKNEKSENAPRSKKEGVKGFPLLSLSHSLSLSLSPWRGIGKWLWHARVLEDIFFRVKERKSMDEKGEKERE